MKIPTLDEVGMTHLGGGDLDVDDDGSEGGLAQLRRVVDGVSVQNHQLQRAGQFKNPLNLTLDLSWRRQQQIRAKIFFLTLFMSSN